MKKRILSIIMTFVLLIGILPSTAFAVQNDWANQAVTTLNQIYGGGFSADDTVMKESDVYNILKSMGCSSDKVTNNSQTNLTRSKTCEVLADVFDLPLNGKTAITYLFEKNIINGKSSGDLDENGTVTNAQFAVLTYRVLNSIGGGEGSSVDALKPATDEYFAWTYLAARKCVPFNVYENSADTQIKDVSISTIVNDNGSWTNQNKQGEDLWNAWISRLNYLNNTDISSSYNGDETLIEAAKRIVKDSNATQIFTDVSPSDFYYDGVMYLFDHQIISGLGDGTFNPNVETKRYELAALLYRYKGSPNGNNPDPLSAAKNYVTSNGYMIPPTENADDWWNEITTREEAIIGIMKACDVDISNVNTTILDRFKNSTITSTVQDADKYVAYAVSIGLVNGTADGSLDLSLSVTRGVAGVLLYRTLIGVDTTKMQDYNESIKYVVSPQTYGALAVNPLAENTVTLTLREDWRLTSDLDLAIPENTTLEIDGQNKYHIYEMGGTLKNSGSNSYKFINNTILYRNNGTNSALEITVSNTSLTGGGTITLTVSGSTNKTYVICDDTSITLTNNNDNTWTATLPNETKTYTFIASADGCTDTIFIVNVTKNTDSGSSGGSSSGGSSSSGNKTETTTNPDGSTTTTVTKPDGSKTETTKYPDGSQEVIQNDKDGTVTTTTTDTNGNKTEVIENNDGSSVTTVTNKDGSGSKTTVDTNGKVEIEATITENNSTLPIASVNTTSNNTITVNMPSTSKVEIPVNNADINTVAVLVNADGTEEIIKTSITTENCVSVTLNDGDTIKIIDNSKDFIDVSNNFWGVNAVGFVTSREIFNGTSKNTFSPNEPMTRAMIVTVLARLNGVDTSTGDIWYEVGQKWAIENGISDGLNMNETLTREQLAVMLYRYLGSPATSGDISNFTDSESVSSWATYAMIWAVENGLISGMGDDTLNPKGEATRAQVATILYRFISNYN